MFYNKLIRSASIGSPWAMGLLGLILLVVPPELSRDWLPGAGGLDSGPTAVAANAIAPDAGFSLTGQSPNEPWLTLQVTAPVDGKIVVAGMSAGSADRELRPGDTVRRGQVLAVIWSLEVGERKSRMLAAASRLLLDEEQLSALGHRGAAAGDLLAAHRHCQLDRESLARAERDLRGLTMELSEIAAIRQCAVRLCQQQPDAVSTLHWAELELRAPSDGVLLRTQAIDGAAVRPGTLLFTIAGR